ncbi:Nuclear pore complex protein, partial [Globisporangium splendens]
MAERESEHVRMIDAGRMRASFASPITTDCFRSVRAKKFHCYAHGNTFGLSFVAAEKGFTMLTNGDYEESCRDYVKRKQIAIDHGQNATHVDLKPLPSYKDISLSSIAYNLALSVDEVYLAVAYGDNLAIYEVAEIYHSALPTAFRTFSNVSVEEIAWCTSASNTFAVLASTGQVTVYSTDGKTRSVDLSSGASSGTSNAEVEIYAQASLELERKIDAPDCCADDDFEAHHINWAEDELILAGFKKFDEDQEETTALACLFENDNWLELEEVVAFYDVENRTHQYYSVFLADWRMFFVGCSLSADVELLVSEPESGEWEIWKPSEKYQARLPMNAQDEESYPLSLVLNLNSVDQVEVDESAFAPAPLVSCATTEGLLVNFAFIDTTVFDELEFVKKPEEFTLTATQKVVPSTATPSFSFGVSSTTTSIAATISEKKEEDKQAYGKNDENEFAESDGEDSDEEAERKEEEDRARDAFRAISPDDPESIDAADFPKLFKKLGSTYSDEEHSGTLKKLNKGGKVNVEDFVSWYLGWLFAEDNSDDEEDESAAESTKPEMKSASEIANAMAKFKPAEGSWKCSVCMVSNPDPKAQKCVSCGSANPDAPKVTAAPQASGAVAASPTFTFSVPSAPSVTPSTTTSPFTFGVAPATSAAAAASPSGFTFGVSSAPSGSPSTATPSFSFGVSSTTTSIAATISEKKEEDKQAYGKNDENEFAESDGEDSDEEAERKEEEDRARDAFRAISPDDPESIDAADFPKLFKKLGSTYSDEEHSGTLKKLNKGGKVNVEDFVSWYLGWLFAEDNSDDEEDESAAESTKPEMKSASEIANAMAKFKPAEGSWKCSVCMVSNPDPKAQKCVSCGSANPDAPKVTAAPQASGAVAASPTFTFSVPSAPSVTPSTTTSPFTFGVASTTPTSAFSFGVPPSTATSPFTAQSTKPPAFGVSSAYPRQTRRRSQSLQRSARRVLTRQTCRRSQSLQRSARRVLTRQTRRRSQNHQRSARRVLTRQTRHRSQSLQRSARRVLTRHTSSKPKPPAFGASSTYPPDTSSKPKPPAFGASSAYPPDTSSKPKPPTFGASSAYPPDTSSKPKPPAFSLASSTSSHVSEKAGSSGIAQPASSSFSFSNFGGGLFGAKDDLALSTSSTPTTATATSIFGKASAAKSLFGAKDAKETMSGAQAPSPFGIVPKSDGKSTFAFPASSGKTAESSASKPAFSTSGPSFGASGASEGSKPSQQPGSRLSPSQEAKHAGDKSTQKRTPKTPLEGQLWKLIIDFDKSFQRVNENSKSIQSEDASFNKKVTSQLRELQTQVSSLCNDINSLDDSRDQIEKDVLFVIGSDGDVHEQLEYGREILASFKDETLKRSLEEQPLDQRSAETRQALKDKLDEVERSCIDLENHLTSGSGSFGSGGASALNSVVSTAHLFRVLKQTYDNSKLQYNRVSSLAQQIDDITLGSERALQSTLRSNVSTFEANASFAKSKVDMVELITDAEERSQAMRQHFLSLCNNVVTPRDVFVAPRRKLTAASASGSSSPLRIKAYSKLMPRTQLTVASPMSSTKSSNSVSFKGTDVKSGSKLFSLAEDKASKEPARIIQTPQRAKPSAGQAPERPALSSFTAPSTSMAVMKKEEGEKIGENPSLAKRSAFGFTSSSVSGPVKAGTGGTTFSFNTESKSTQQESEKAPVTLSLGSVLPPKPKTPASTGSEKKDPSTPTKLNFGSSFSLEKSDVTTDEGKQIAAKKSNESADADYKGLLVKFYQEYNPSKVSDAEKTLGEYVGKEQELFSKLFAKYIPSSNSEDVKKYLAGGPLPKKQAGFGAPSAAVADSSKTAFSPFGAPKPATTASDASKKPSPFGATSSFGLGTAPSPSSKPAAPASGFGAFGSTATSAFGSTSSTSQAPQFGQASVDYRQKLVDFYTKHNPGKLGDVDSTLAKYKGNEEKLFQNLAIKYKTTVPGVPSSPAIQPAKPSAASSPFGNAGSFSSIGTSGSAPSTTPSFGATNPVGFGAKAAAAPSQSPFGTTAQTSGFGNTGGVQQPAFGTTVTLGSGGFGKFQAGGASTGTGFGSSNQFGATGVFGAQANNQHRERLVKFYQQHNPEKLKDVDSTLEKYKGQEAKLFAMLEQKYLGKPTAPAFGVASTPSFGGGFGASATLGATSATPAFGSASALGGAAQPAFGGTSQPAFGAASAFGTAARGGGGFAAPASSGTATTGSGFSSFSSQGTGFSGFAAQASTGAFGGAGFGSGATPSGFGQPSTFGSSSFTQMR